MKSWSPSMYIVLVLIVLSGRAFAHPMPNSLVLLNMGDHEVGAELHLPLNELQLALPFDVSTNPETLIQRLGPQLNRYIIEHFKAFSRDALPWKVTVERMAVKHVDQSLSGPYHEIVAWLRLKAPAEVSENNLVLKYDVILHQLVTHTALVRIQHDWKNGINAENPVEVGAIELDVPSNTIPSLVIDLEEGSVWRGFKSMVMLGIHHIREGTDHLLFLLVLLLPAPLLTANNKWTNFGGARYSVVRSLRIVTAFTIGHSITLLVGALSIVHLPGKWVEVVIALSILISAVHALRPLFDGKEMMVAGLFGLVHGLAFATILNDLSLDPGKMALSILGFNIGIELMQVFVILLTMPWLILISRSSYYYIIRTTGASFAIVASAAWIFERSLETTTRISSFIEGIASYSFYLVFILPIIWTMVVIMGERKTHTSQGKNIPEKASV